MGGRKDGKKGERKKAFSSQAPKKPQEEREFLMEG